MGPQSGAPGWVKGTPGRRNLVPLPGGTPYACQREPDCGRGQAVTHRPSNPRPPIPPAGR